jgi:peptidoglycan/LPS O-acetylase OafA/YrhL
MLYISFMSIDLEIAARARREAGGAKKLAIPAVMRSLGDNTIASALARHRGEGPGFGLMRLALATLICFYHSIHLGGGASAVSGQNTQAALAGFTGLTGPTRPFLVVLVPMFFALSGFLVTGSAFRVRVTSTFLAFRALRIFPALSVEVALSALILGPIFTTLPWREYFSHPNFFRYFGNIVGLVTFHLPGVFETNRITMVNGNLWTLPPEFHCYLITALLMVSGLIYWRTAFSIVLAPVTIVFLVLNSLGDFGQDSFAFSGATMTYYFFIGMLFFHWKEYIPIRWWLFAISVVASYILLLSRHTIFLAPLFVSYCTVVLGVIDIPEIKWLKNRDYSYGIYLYGYPIAQAWLAAVPGLRGHIYFEPMLAFVTAVLFAAWSWHNIEKPMLMLKDHLPNRFFPARSPAREPSAAQASRA